MPGGQDAVVNRADPSTAVTLGSERLLASGALDGARVGVVANPASVDHAYRHIADRVAEQPGVTLAALFGPQHGFHADVQDNMVETGHAQHPRLGVPVYSLYSDTREPSAEMLRRARRPRDRSAGRRHPCLHLRLDDGQLPAGGAAGGAARRGVRPAKPDRRRRRSRGRSSIRRARSFVGQLAIPLRHGLTMGELARLFNEHFGIGGDLEVAPLGGWSRAMYHDDAAAPWVIPSPNLPTLDSALVYPGMVLVEGTMLSEGRGTTRPFELAGAPGIDPDRLAAGLNELDLPGARFRPATFEPTFQKHAGRTCGGCQIHVTDRRAFRPVLTGVAVVQACRRAAPEHFAWREPPYEYEHRRMPIDILAGTGALRRDLDADRPALDIAAGWDSEVSRFEAVRRPFLLY